MSYQKYITYLIPVFLFVGCTMYPDDNLLEEEIEEVIMQKSGVNIDFSGRSKED